MMPGRPLVFGEVLHDVFPDGSRVLGGAPFNVSWHLQAFGCEPLLISRVGDDEAGEAIRRRMTGWNMDAHALQRDAQHPTGYVQVSLVAGEPRFEIAADSAWDHIDTPSLPEPGHGILYHGSLALRHRDSRRSFELLRERCGSPVFVDLNLRSPWWNASFCRELLDAARWAKLNEDELRTMAPDDSQDVAESAAKLCARHDLAWLVVTLGAAGALVTTRAGELHHARPSPCTVVDTVGAGDAFASVMILGLLRGWELDCAVGRAQRFAEMVVGWRGATAADPAPYRLLLDEWKEWNR